MDELESFANWYYKNDENLHFVPLKGAVFSVSGAYGVTMYTSSEYQVQMWVVPPNFIIPEHTHPNVDSFEVYVGGQIKFSHKGFWVVEDEDLKVPALHGLSRLRGQVIRVKPNDLHGGCFGPSGGVFLSIQHWLNGVRPSCVSKDYDGIGIDENHKPDCGNVIHKELTWRDAASMEEEAPFWEV